LGAWGDTAFYKLVNLRRGRYKVNEAQDVGGADATLTACSWQELLMEAARLQDEAERVARSATATGRVIAFPTPASHAAAFDLPALAPAVMAYAAPAVAPIALPHIPPPAPASIAPVSAAALPFAPAATATPRRVSQTMELPGIDELRDAARGGVNRPALPGEPPADGKISPLWIDGDGPSPTPDFTRLMEEATASYLRRDLARTEALLQQCLALRPGDKRVVQNLERVQRKKSP